MRTCSVVELTETKTTQLYRNVAIFVTYDLFTNNILRVLLILPFTNIVVLLCCAFSSVRYDMITSI